MEGHSISVHGVILRLAYKEWLLTAHEELTAIGCTALDMQEIQHYHSEMAVAICFLTLNI